MHSQVHMCDAARMQVHIQTLLFVCAQVDGTVHAWKLALLHLYPKHTFEKPTVDELHVILPIAHKVLLQFLYCNTVVKRLFELRSLGGCIPAKLPCNGRT